MTSDPRPLIFGLGSWLSTFDLRPSPQVFAPPVGVPLADWPEEDRQRYRREVGQIFETKEAIRFLEEVEAGRVDPRSFRTGDPDNGTYRRLPCVQGAYLLLVEWPPMMRSFLKEYLRLQRPPKSDPVTTPKDGERVEASVIAWRTFASLPLVQRLGLTSREPQWLVLPPPKESLGPCLWGGLEVPTNVIEEISLANFEVWRLMGAVCKSWRTWRASYQSFYQHSFRLVFDPIYGLEPMVEGHRLPVPRGLILPSRICQDERAFSISSETPDGSDGGTPLVLEWHDGSYTAGSWSGNLLSFIERYGSRFSWKTQAMLAPHIYLFLKGKLSIES